MRRRLIICLAITTILLVAPPRARAQQVRALEPCPPAEPGNQIAGRAAIDAAVTCVGWLAAPEAGSGAAGVFALEISADTASFVPAGIGVAANELFSAIAAIAVDRSRRQGLALVKEALVNGVCELEFPIPSADTFRLLETCTLIRTSDLLALVGQGRALRTALTSDVLSAADAVAVGRLQTLPPLARSASAAVVLVRRIVSDPDAHLTRNDVWLVTDAFLNGSWPTLENADQQRRLTTMQISLAAARVYLEALKRASAPGEVDLAYAIRKMVEAACAQQQLDSCPYIDIATSKLVIEWTNLAVKAASAMSADGKTEDFRARLRANVQLVFSAYGILTGATDRAGTNLGTLQLTFPAWAEAVTLAAIDTDAPRLISTVAQLASAAVSGSCTSDCAVRRKVATLLTGISTYAVTYETIPADADAATKAALLESQREARRTAVEAVIDAATDRRGRDGTWVWSLGTGVGVTLTGRQRLDLTVAQGGDLSETIRGQLHVPLGVSLQRLPAAKWIGVHTMFTALDLGNYVAETDEVTGSPDWRAIFFPGGQVGVAIGRPTNFVVIGLDVGYSPRFLKDTTPESSGRRGARRATVFAEYYVPLWDLN